uniref:Uncharacterized protein n=1 Tax=viral metagenome TaxID=1070528 RepID=A0A6M3KMH5_9ZZZZ
MKMKMKISIPKKLMDNLDSITNDIHFIADKFEGKSNSRHHSTVAAWTRVEKAVKYIDTILSLYKNSRVDIPYEEEDVLTVIKNILLERPAK